MKVHVLLFSYPIWPTFGKLCCFLYAAVILRDFQSLLSLVLFTNFYTAISSFPWPLSSFRVKSSHLATRSSSSWYINDGGHIINLSILAISGTR